MSQKLPGAAQRTPEERKAYQQAWYQANKERVKARINARYKAAPAEHKARAVARAKAYNLAHPEKKNAANKAWCLRNPHKVKTKWMQARYGITFEEYERMRAAQGGRCAICGTIPSGDGSKSGSLHIDHNHVTSKNRDLLCFSCNVGIGHLRDDPAVLRAAIGYLEKHGSTQARPEGNDPHIGVEGGVGPAQRDPGLPIS